MLFCCLILWHCQLISKTPNHDILQVSLELVVYTIFSNNSLFGDAVLDFCGYQANETNNQLCFKPITMEITGLCVTTTIICALSLQDICQAPSLVPCHLSEALYFYES